MASVEILNLPQVLRRVSTPNVRREEILPPREAPRDQSNGLVRIQIGGGSMPRVVTTPVNPKVKTDEARTVEVGQIAITQYASGGVEICNKRYQEQRVRVDEAQIDEMMVALDAVLEQRMTKVSKASR